MKEKALIDGPRESFIHVEKQMDVEQLFVSRLIMLTFMSEKRPAKVSLYLFNNGSIFSIEMNDVKERRERSVNRILI